MFHQQNPTNPNITITNCDCPQPGFCPRHHCRKSSHMWKLCRSRPDYFHLWEANNGPGQHNSVSTLTEIQGLGDLLAWYLKRLGLDRLVKRLSQTLGISDCGCQKRRSFLNRLWNFRPPSS